MKVGVYILLLFFLFFSCKHVETGHVTVIHLQPNEKSILKVSDYFNRVEAVLLRDTFFFGVEDFIEGADKYIVLASDHPGLMQGKDRYYVFDKEGYFRNCIGTVGRGTGEYREIRNGLQMGEDSLLKIIDINKYLSYSLDGKVMQRAHYFQQKIKLLFIQVRGIYGRTRWLYSRGIRLLPIIRLCCGPLSRIALVFARYTP